MNISKIVIIDDSEIDQYFAKYTITKFNPNIEILQAFDGEEGLDVLRGLTTQPDLIFLDINMPRMNGHEFLEQYDNWDESCDAVIMLTSSDQEQDKEKSLAFNCVKKYCVKPIEEAYLKNIIEEEL